MKGLTMTKDAMFDFIGKIGRDELRERPIEYCKAVRVTLISLGFDEEWVNGEFRSYLETTYEYEFDEFRG